ncbi:MAG TPA: hypothetical protein VF423_07215 [Actinomycetes bacterium]
MQEVGLSPCQSSDNGDPHLVSVAVTTPLVDVRNHSRRVRFSAQVGDSGGPGPASGVSIVSVFLRHSDGGRWHEARMRQDAGGSWSGGVRLWPGVRPGDWNIVSVALRDAAGQAARYGGAELAARTTVDHVTVRAHKDRRRPRLLDHTMVAASDPSTGRRWVRVRVEATDRFGIESLTASFSREGGGFTEVERLPRRAGTARSGVWGRRVVIPGDAAGGRWSAAVEARDRSGHVTSIGHGGKPPTVLVPSRTDRSAPTVEVRSFTPGVVDVRNADGVVAVDVRATDVGGGVGDVEIAVDRAGTGDAFGRRVRATRVSGSARDGVWRGHAPIRTCTLWDPPDSLLLHVVVRDRAGQASGGWMPVTGLDLLTTDRRPPTARIASPMPSHGPVLLTFGEDAVGLRPEALEVTLATGRLLNEPGTDLQKGTWTCEDGSGTTVDCVTGPVRTASFVPEDPAGLRAGWYVVELNPDHVLAIMDAAGNAPDRVAVPFSVQD